MRKLNLRQLILLLSVSTAVLILANTFYTSHKTQRDLLIAQTLEANQAYALKIADSIEDFLSAAQQQLAFAAQDVLLAGNNLEKLGHIANRLNEQTDSFNSVFIVDTSGVVIAASPEAVGLFGKVVMSEGTEQALRERIPLVSKPYVSVTGRLLVFISQPIIDAQDNYLGFIGGSIYLHEKSILYSLLGRHYHANDAYIYAVDSGGRIIYHQDAERIGEVIVGNPVIEKVVKQQTGSQYLLNSHGIEMLAGYAPVPSANWGVVTQRSLEATLSGMDQQMLAVAKYSFPFFIFIVWLVWLVSRWISKPLWQLARSAEDLDEPDINTQISSISVWYFEASQLKRAMLRGLAGLNKKMGKLNLETITDPLTGLINRRGMQIALDEWQQAAQPFSVITGDIDHFKQINDEHGHDVGDEVLKYLAKSMQKFSRPDDLVCRTGGEEFMLLLPQTDITIACKIAQRLCDQIASEVFPAVGRPITLSFGVANWPHDGESIASVMKSADQALYAAKEAGRNRVHRGQKLV